MANGKSKSEIYQDLVTRHYYVINACELKVVQEEPNLYWVSTYNVYDGKTHINEIWLLSFEEIDAIASLMHENIYSSEHSRRCWDDALDVAKELQSFFDTLTKSEL